MEKQMRDVFAAKQLCVTVALVCASFNFMGKLHYSLGGTKEDCRNHYENLLFLPYPFPKAPEMLLSEKLVSLLLA